MKNYKRAKEWINSLEDDWSRVDIEWGAVDEIRELLDKATPKKPIGDLDSVPHYRCPSCFCTVKLFDDSHCDKYCQHCGQKIDWSKDETKHNL